MCNSSANENAWTTTGRYQQVYCSVRSNFSTSYFNTREHIQFFVHNFSWWRSYDLQIWQSSSSISPIASYIYIYIPGSVMKALDPSFLSPEVFKINLVSNLWLNSKITKGMYNPRENVSITWQSSGTCTKILDTSRKTVRQYKSILRT